MKFKTAELRAAVASALETHRQLYEEQCVQEREKFLAAAKQHAERYNPAWESALPKLRKAIREGQPITVKMLPQDNSHTWSRVALFENAVPKLVPYRPAPDLIVMQNALRLVEDEFIATTQLRTLGCSASMLRTVFELARDQQARTAAAAKPASKPKVTRSRKTIAAVPDPDRP